jgi:uncharacterized cupin superfamily protein
MENIQVEHHPDSDKLDKLGVFSWPIWTKEVSEFPWSYDVPETCYFLEGEVAVMMDGEKPVEIGKGDVVTFPAGLSCTWKIKKDVKKHYQFQ